MWPFTSKTLKDRYSKLIKLIMSIDSHFQITENTEKSVRLHLPNYKGNQPMDFHIYLMESFLYISFVTEVEGEKISILNYYPQSTDQQDMFNMAMSRNMNKIMQALENKENDTQDNSKENKNKSEEKLVKKEYSTKIKEESQSGAIPKDFLISDLRDNFDLDFSIKKHALTIAMLRPGTAFFYYAPQGTEALWMYNGELFCDQNDSAIGATAFIWIMKQYEQKEKFCYLLDFLDRCKGKDYLEAWTSSVSGDPEEMIRVIKKNIPSLKIGNDPNTIKPIIYQGLEDLKAINHFIDYCTNSLKQLPNSTKTIYDLKDCDSFEDLVHLFLKENNISLFDKKDKDIDIWGQEQPVEKTEKQVVVNSWGLMDFARKHGQMKVLPRATHINPITGEEYEATSCAFVHPTEKDEQGRTKVIFVDFSSELGELSPQEIVAQKNDLIVVELKSGNYVLKHRNENSISKEKLTNTVTGGQNKNVDNIILQGLFNGKLKDEQRYSLYYFAALLGGRLYYDELNEKVNKEEINELLHYYQEDLELTDKEAQFIESDDFNLSLEQLTAYIRSIKNDYYINGLLMTCVSLADLRNDENAEKTFFKLAQRIGFSEEETKERIRKNSFQNEKFFFDKITEIKKDDWAEAVRIGGSICKNNRLLVNTYGIKIPDGISIICDEALKYQHLVFENKDLFLPDSVTHIGNKAFCEQPICSVNIPKSVVYIGVNPFVGCRDLVEVHCDSDNFVFVDGALYTKYMRNIISCINRGNLFVVPDSVQTIAELAFEGCKNLSSIRIPNSVLEIGDYSFSGCNSLVEISIPDSIKWIGRNPFIHCSKLNSIICHSDRFIFQNDVLYDSSGTLITCINQDETIIVPNSIKTIWDFSFYGCKYLKHISLPDSIKFIGKNAFEYCESLKEVIIPNSVTTIGEKAFRGCYSFLAISLPDSIKHIDKETFAFCKSLKYISLPNSLEIIGDYAFEGCECLEYVSVYNSITQIGIGAFYRCWSLKFISIPKSIKKIGESAFEECTGLEYINLPDSVEEIGDNAFLGCGKLAAIQIPEGTKEKFEILLPEYKYLLVEQTTNYDYSAGKGDNR